MKATIRSLLFLSGLCVTTNLAVATSRRTREPRGAPTKKGDKGRMITVPKSPTDRLVDGMKHKATSGGNPSFSLMPPFYVAQLTYGILGQYPLQNLIKIITAAKETDRHDILRAILEKQGDITTKINDASPEDIATVFLDVQKFLPKVIVG